VYAHDAAAALIPASTVKLLTAITALTVLGPEFRFETRAVLAAAPADGVVDRIVLVGGGDPLLSTPEYAAAVDEEPISRGNPTTSMADLADAIVASGVRSVPGGIAFDDSRHDDLRVLPSWRPSYLGESIGPLGALEVNGGIVDWNADIAADDPGRHAADELARLLSERGVTVGAPRERVGEYADGPSVNVTSVPLTEIVGEMLSSSDNLTAELLVREIGLAARGEATTAAGTEVVLAQLDEFGLDTTGVVILDGSGLSRDTRVTCALLDASLALTDRPELASARTGLSVAGTRGTLATRLGGTPLEGRLFAKTGTLDGVSGLAGFVEVLTPLRFAYLANGSFSEQSAYALREEVATVLSRYPDVPPADVLVPLP
jgi:D-alanyl-D-alanine carboxypeptidase/D-alanyl-D-alanine-endopeptidase (penicillin-binding protein 4)